jgi:hypothetical protein
MMHKYREAGPTGRNQWPPVYFDEYQDLGLDTSRNDLSLRTAAFHAYFCRNEWTQSNFPPSCSYPSFS